MAAKRDPESGKFVHSPAARRPPECPICSHTDQTEKAASVLRRNTGTFLVANAAPSSFQTLLGSQLAQPRRPAEPSWASAFRHIAFNVIFSALLYAVPGLVEQLAGVTVPSVIGTAIMVAVIWLGLVMPSVSLLRTFRAKSAYPDLLAQWQTAQERWHRLYYCSRDDLCFVEGENECRPPEDVRGLLYGALPGSAPASADLARIPL